MIKIKNILIPIMGIASGISFLFCFLWQNGRYSSISLLPLAFLLTLIILFHKTPKNKDIQISYYIVLVLSFFRLVLIPFVSVQQGVYANIIPHLLNKSIGLVLYEHVCLFIIFWFLYNNRKKNNHNKCIPILRGYPYIYLVYILFAIVIYFLYGRGLDLFDFIVKPVNVEYRSGDITNFRTLMIRQVVSTAVIFSFLVITYYFNKKYNASKKKTYINLSIFVALILVSIIVGERRSNQVYVAFAAIWTLVSLYPESKKKIEGYIISVTLFVLLLMTIYKQMNAFLYSSYSEAFEASDMGSLISGNMLDAYFYGLKTISKNLDFADRNNFGFSVFLFDITRNIFGLNYFIGGNSLTTSELYNNSIYLGEQTTGFLFSSIIHGYTYFGLLLAPLCTILNLLILFFLEKHMKRCISIEMTYIIAYIFMRFGFGLYGNIAPLLNFSTRFFIINSIIFVISRSIQTPSKRINYKS